MDNSDPAVATAALLEGGLDFRLVAHEINLSNRRVGLQRQPDPIDDDPAAVVATHDIDYDSHKSEERRSNYAQQRPNVSPRCRPRPLVCQQQNRAEELKKGNGSER